jgi:Protein of unknown function (DUF1549)/Protein of unknown function (DUF1553)
MRMLRFLGASVFFLASTVHAGDAAKPAAADTARQVDKLLLKARDTMPLPERIDDTTYLRRLSLDLTGKIPDAKELQAFLTDRDPHKRGKLADRLLMSEGYAINWGRYWRDVLTYHTPASGNYLRWQLFDQWMIDQVRSNRGWGEVVTSLVTSTGINDECAPVNFLTAHFGNPIEIAATTSRVFLGVQLQCAQCHDAKNEPWKREQFHELVAFFGRSRIIQHKDVDGKGRGTPYAIEGRADGQYFMPDKKDPQKLISMSPKFLTGESISADADDLERRTALAKFLTSPKNPWFAKAYVNRIWTALMGWGFYPAVTDLGADIQPRDAEVLNLLAKEWTASGYNARWLLRVIVSTDAYQRRLQPRPDADSMTPAASICPNRLRPEQVFEAMVRALGFDENDKSIPAPAPGSNPAVQRHSGLRNMIYHAFKIDPSMAPDEVQGTIPQALLMMNSVLVDSYISAKGKTFLADALEKKLPTEEIVTALYERTLSRRPNSRELTTINRFMKTVPDRREALEDVFWTLLNSTEFLTKR